MIYVYIIYVTCQVSHKVPAAPTRIFAMFRCFPTSTFLGTGGSASSEGRSGQTPKQVNHTWALHFFEPPKSALGQRRNDHEIKKNKL